MIDITPEINAFKNAVYGEDVRDAMVKLATDLADESKTHFPNLGTSTSLSLTDLNNWVQEGFIYIPTNAAVANSPSTSAQRVLMYTSGSVYTQISFTITSTFEIYVRSKLASSSNWGSWKKLSFQIENDSIPYEALQDDTLDQLLSYIKISHESDTAAYNRLLSNMPRNTFLLINPSWVDDAPSSFDGTIVVFTFGGSALTSFRYQFVVQLKNGLTAMRYHTTNQSYGNWIYNKDMSGYEPTAELWAFGDSIVKGQIGRTETITTITTSDYNYPTMAARRLGMVVKNRAIGGTGLVNNNAQLNAMVDNVDDDPEYDMSNAKIIIVGYGGYNEHPLDQHIDMGVYTDTTQESFVGYLYRFMKKIQEKYPYAIVMYVSGFGAGLKNGTQFSTVRSFYDGQHTWGEFYDELEKMCNLRGWPCINQHLVGCGTNPITYNVWTADNVNDDPHFSDAGYKVYGNFLSGKIASCYSNLK